jgi:acyl dehydratase
LLAWLQDALVENARRCAGGIAAEELVMIEWFDDLTLGIRFKSKEAQITADDIKRFAAEFDPQPFHLDESAAQLSVFKGLAASGWHTAAIAMRLAVEARPFGPHPLIGLGVDDLRWMAPVRPGDVLHLEGEVIGLTPSRTKPQGIARVKWTALTQSGEAVYSFTPIGIVPRRPNVPIGEAIAN